ncbi:hypothetical protein GM415_11475 [Pseudodesulfovibrio cashew]|uniref:PilZ domain-containing protein n=1 Tax=Pseudodesulfovibrio cashew TaxID=2678688 RepID=A0A6I6JID1_9BACT|nr:hypothetical protein [Pseudodesulfovibrio cashew]QGY40718.1 hypothetical protein GM415_11475 [Pseudodesulfovibrio cashew]
MREKSYTVQIESRSGNREAYRAGFSDLQLRIDDRSAPVAVINLSPVGVGLRRNVGMTQGQEAVVHLYRKGVLVIPDLAVRVARVSASATGLAFLGLTRKQTDEIHSVVLEEQKRQLSGRNRVRLDSF